MFLDDENLSSKIKKQKKTPPKIMKPEELPKGLDLCYMNYYFLRMPKLPRQNELFNFKIYIFLQLV